MATVTATRTLTSRTTVRWRMRDGSWDTNLRPTERKSSTVPHDVGRHPAGRAHAVLLRLGDPGLCVPGRLRAAGAGGRHALDLRRADDARVRVVSRGALGRRLPRRRPGRAHVAADRPRPRSPRG